MHEITIFQFFLRGCNDNRQRAGQTQQLHLGLEYGPGSLHTPVAAPAEAVLAIAGTRPNSDMATGSCPSRAAAGRGPTVEWLLLAGLVRATSVPACSRGASPPGPAACPGFVGPWLGSDCRLQSPLCGP